jgi:hypothetical protein
MNTDFCAVHQLLFSRRSCAVRRVLLLSARAIIAERDVQNKAYIAYEC